MNSAIFVGGWDALLAALIGAMLLAYWIPAEYGWLRWRVAAFFLGWQAFTPIMPWYVDLPMLMICVGAQELIYRIATRVRVRVS